MKTLKYILLAIILGINLVACTPDDIGLENDVIEVVETEELATKGEYDLSGDTDDE